MSGIGPRRLAHVNLFVADLDRSTAFYRDVCGLRPVFEESALRARFLSNGNSHHDVALMEASGEERRGRDGHVQQSAARGSRPGLNHLGFEMATQAELVAGVDRAGAGRIARMLDHQISHSAYLPGPDGVDVEVYADATTDWRGAYERADSGLLSSVWTPPAGADATTDPRYEHDPVLDAVEGAPARPARTARAAVVAEDVGAAVAFYTDVLGLAVLGRSGPDVVLGGRLRGPDLLVLATDGGLRPGFHHFSLELAPGESVASTAERLAAVVLDDRVVVTDPDGTPVELVEPGASPWGAWVREPMATRHT